MIASKNGRAMVKIAVDMVDDRALGFMAVRCHEIHLDGPATVVERIRSRVGDRPVYVSVDIDVLDPAYAPGTGTPESGGLAAWQLLYMLRQLAGLNLVGGDVVEVSPPFDASGNTALVGATMLFEILCVLAESVRGRRGAR